MSILVIIESPGKRKKLDAILGDGYVVAPSFGHVRDMPEKELGLAAPSYSPKYEVSSRSAKTVAALRKLSKSCDSVVFASDPDREGEAISWHLAQLLSIPNPKRVTFNEISSVEVLRGFANPRPLDMGLVNAQLARRSIDRLVGYQVSKPLSDRLNTFGLSAGRVQSPALAILVDLERSISNFESRTHFNTLLHFSTGSVQWSAKWDYEKLLTNAAEKLWLDPGVAELVAGVSSVRVISFVTSTSPEAPPPPFITSTLQQAASVALGFSPEKTMELAQGLYEDGLISYHRTDSPNLSESSFQAICAYAIDANLPVVKEQRKWKSKASAQEAHEAIRPADFSVATTSASPEHNALYRLIRLRAIASQMANAEYDVRQGVLAGPGKDGVEYSFKAIGRKLVFKGWRQVLPDIREDGEGEGDEVKGNPVPVLRVGDELRVERGGVTTHHTQPPKRLSEAGLIRVLEELGIGRPSTYATIMKGIKQRGYVALEKKRLVPAEIAFKICDNLKPYFSFIGLDYTKAMEERLDLVAQNKATYLEVVREVDQTIHAELKALGVVEKPIQAAGEGVGSGGGGEGAKFKCPHCNKPLSRRTRKSDSKPFWGCSGYPKCNKTFADVDGEPDLKASQDKDNFQRQKNP